MPGLCKILEALSFPVKIPAFFSFPGKVLVIYDATKYKFCDVSRQTNNPGLPSK